MLLDQPVDGSKKERRDGCNVQVGAFLQVAAQVCLVERRDSDVRLRAQHGAHIFDVGQEERLGPGVVGPVVPKEKHPRLACSRLFLRHFYLRLPTASPDEG